MLSSIVYVRRQRHAAADFLEALSTSTTIRFTRETTCETGIDQFLQQALPLYRRTCHCYLGREVFRAMPFECPDAIYFGRFARAYQRRDD